MLMIIFQVKTSGLRELTILSFRIAVNTLVELKEHIQFVLDIFSTMN